VLRQGIRVVTRAADALIKPAWRLRASTPVSRHQVSEAASSFDKRDPTLKLTERLRAPTGTGTASPSAARDLDQASGAAFMLRCGSTLTHLKLARIVSTHRRGTHQVSEAASRLDDSIKLEGRPHAPTGIGSSKRIKPAERLRAPTELTARFGQCVPALDQKLAGRLQVSDVQWISIKPAKRLRAPTVFASRFDQASEAASKTSTPDWRHPFCFDIPRALIKLAERLHVPMHRERRADRRRLDQAIGAASCSDCGSSCEVLRCSRSRSSQWSGF